MAQPKKPPISLRLNEETLKAIDAAAADMHESRHATILMAIGRGLEDWGFQVVTEPVTLPPGIPFAKNGPHVMFNRPEPLRMPRAPIGSLAKKPKR